MKKMSVSVLALFLLVSTFSLSAQNKYVGGDISMIPSYEASSAVYIDANGKRINDLVSFFAGDAGFNIARLRLFVEVQKGVGVVQTLDYVLPLAKRVKDAGMKLMLDFHYSDTWADPSNQWIPASWATLTEQQLLDTVYTYTKYVLEQLVANGATPDYIQTGNEISYGMLWGPEGKKTYYCHYDKDANWDRFRALLTNAGKACREVCPEAKIIIHTERTNNTTGTVKIYNRLSTIDYDIIGLSYYPEWHNNIATLKRTLESLATSFPEKELMIVETGYFNNWYNKNATYDFQTVWPASPAGQKAFLDELVELIKSQQKVTGLLYWFPEENPYNNHVYEPWYNHGLFNPNNGRVSEAMFSLKNLLPEEPDPSGVDNMSDQAATLDKDTPVFTIDGRLLPSARNLPQGIYLQNGKKIAVF